MNLPDPEFLAAARATLADWPDIDVRFGGSSPGIATPAVIPPGANLVDELRPVEDPAEISDSDICPKTGAGHVWRKTAQLVLGQTAKYCRDCTTRRVLNPGDVLEAPRDLESCPKNGGGAHSWRLRNDSAFGRLVQVKLCGRCKTRRNVTKVAA